MATTTAQSVSFADTDSRYDDMHSAIEAWIEELSELVDEAQTSEEFQAWLDVQSRFHDYSYRNTLLIKQQCPEAPRVAGYRTWKAEFDRHVREGEEAIWIWAPIIASQCPDCGNSPSYHEISDCEYDETPPEEWVYGYGLLVAVDCASDLPTGAVVVQRKQHPETATLECFERLGENTDVTVILGESAYDTLEFHDRCVDRQYLPICTYNPRSTNEPLDIVFRIEAIAEEHGVQLDQDALRAAFADRIGGERFFSTLKGDERRLSFRVHGRRRVETHVGLVLIDRLITALANRLDDPNANPRKVKPW